MLKTDYLMNVLNYFEEGITWFFMQLKSEELCKVRPKDLLELPPNYIIKMRDFVSRYTLEELEEIDPVEFIEQATGESYHKILKLIKVAKKKQSLEQDFV